MAGLCSAAEIEQWREKHRKRSRERYVQVVDAMKQHLGGKCVRCGATSKLKFVRGPSVSTFAPTPTLIWCRSWDFVKLQLRGWQLFCRWCQPKARRPTRQKSNVQHGEQTMYGRGCRCRPCLAAHAAYRKSLRRRRRERAAAS